MSGTSSGDWRGLGQEEVRSCAREGWALQNVAMIQLRPAGAGQNWRQRPFSGTGGDWGGLGKGVSRAGLVHWTLGWGGTQRAEVAAQVARCAVGAEGRSGRARGVLFVPCGEV